MAPATASSIDFDFVRAERRTKKDTVAMTMTITRAFMLLTKLQTMAGVRREEANRANSMALAVRLTSDPE